MEEETFFSEGSVVSVLTAEPIEKLLDYLVPAGGVSCGEFVEVELGRRVVQGFVWGNSIASSRYPNLKTLRSRQQKYTVGMKTRNFLTKMADYNLTSLNSILRLTGWRNFLKNTEKPTSGFRLTDFCKEKDDHKISSQGRRVIELLSSLNEDQECETFQKISGKLTVSGSVIKTLLKQGLIEKVVLKDKAKSYSPPLVYSSNLSLEQTAASEEIKKIMVHKPISTILLRGVTGSGKTEVFLNLAAKTLSKSLQVLILVPEIGLSSGLISRVSETLGITPVEWNSGVRTKRKREIFKSLISNDGQIQLVVGARSALFLPFKKLGLIIIDEEHDISYKQQDGVRFHARDMGVLRAYYEKISIILSSATPSLETILNCKNNKYERVDITKRFKTASEVSTTIIDLKNEEIGEDKALSPTLIKLINEQLNDKKQVLLFLNRRGYAPLIVCKSCGIKQGCKYCESKLVEHKRLNCRICHQCGNEYPIENRCSSCRASDSLSLVGFGVERLMEECKLTFPGKKTKIISSDQTSTKGSLQEGIVQIEKGEIDIVIGTQIIAKGHNFPFLSLVGIVDGDLGLYGGDLRSAEKAFQVIQQVSGRVGRFEKKGYVAIQSWYPKNDIIQAVVRGDADEFWDQELSSREDVNAPPFSKFIAIIFEGNNKNLLFRSANFISKEFSKLEEGGIKVFGPALAPISRIKGRFRVRILLQCPKEFVGAKIFQDVLRKAKITRSQKVIMDVDPQNFL